MKTVLSPKIDHQQAGMKATLLPQRILPVTLAAKSAREDRWIKRLLSRWHPRVTECASLGSVWIRLYDMYEFSNLLD